MHYSKLIEGKKPDQPSIQTSGFILSYGELERLVERVARYLESKGVEPGDRVIVRFPNGCEHIISVFAVTSIGAIAVPAGADGGSRRLQYMGEVARPSLCLSNREDVLDFNTETTTLEYDSGERSIRFSRAFEDTPDHTIGRSKVELDFPAVILFSSGSTGDPKGVVLNHSQLNRAAELLSRVYQLDENHRELIVSPLSHSGAWQRTASTLMGGGCVILPEPPLTVSGFFEDIRQFEITGYYTPPPIVRMILRSPPSKARAALERCRSIEVGSASLAPDELSCYMDLSPEARFYVHYGLTECSRAVILEARAHPDKLHTVGRPAPGVELSIRDNGGEPLDPGQEGQICLRAPHQASGYWKRPDLKQGSFDGGWILSGDYGKLDEEGFLTYLGRRDDMISTGGYSFFPAEIEGELGAFDDVEEYVVAGVADPRGIMGEVPWAFVVPASDKEWSPKDFLRSARQCLPAYKVPRRVVTVPSLPMTGPGKPDRRRIVALYGRSG